MIIENNDETVPSNVRAMRVRFYVYAAMCAAIAVTGVVASIYTGTGYGYVVFVGLPFLVGLFWGWFAGRDAVQAYGYAMYYMTISLVVAAVVMMAFALEGIVCVAMAAPFVWVMAAIGVLTGRLLHFVLGPFVPSTWFIVFTIALAPMLMGAEAAIAPAPPVYAVTTCIDIDAPRDRVWKHVVTFPELAPPTEFIFRAGVAFPKHARIEGEGVGAMRYCVFNTGEFVEPIAVWDEPSLLKFSVTENPAPLTETSFYGEIHPPHLDGYMEAKQGQFKLIALPNGGTRIEGTTWYSHGLWPASYWRLWSDPIIHAVHGRVLAHIKTLAESE